MDSDFNAGSDENLKHFKALDEQRENLPPGHPRIAQSLGRIAAVYFKQGKYGEALKYYEDALEIRREIWPEENHPRCNHSHCPLSSLSYNHLSHIITFDLIL